MSESVRCEGRRDLASESMTRFLFYAVWQAYVCTTDIRSKVYTNVILCVILHVKKNAHSKVFGEEPEILTLCDLGI
jgi:hypothetical protein